MLRTGRLTLSILLGLLLIVPFAAGQASPRHKTHKKAAPKPLPLPPMPAGPLTQVPMEQIPAVAPQVTYHNGSLAIVAQNSTLAEIMREVRKRTGATVDMPPNANERVVTRLGPGPMRDVLVSLLNGCSFNYIMLGSVADPTTISTIVLTAKPAAGGAQPAAVAYQPNQGFVPPQRMAMGPQGVIPPPLAVTPAQNADGADDAEEKEEEDTTDQDQADDQADGQAAGQPGQATTIPEGAPQPNAGPKTPEQILQMMQRQQQQPPQPGNPPDQQPPQ